MKRLNSTQTLRARLQNESGVALFLTLILVSTLSILTVSMMFLAQSESFSSGNYRLMTQSRYGAEAGVQKAADYILQTDLSTAAPGLIALLPVSQSPVQYNFKDVVLSSDPDPAQSNFPDAAVITAFQAAAGGQVVAGNSTINFTATAKLLALAQIQDGYTGVNKLVQTWEVTSTAFVNGVRKSEVQVSAILDNNQMPTIAYGAFGTDPGCGSLKFQGNVQTNSYDPYNKLGQPQPLTMYDTGGDVGTNGNLDIQGSVDVKGNLSSPITGVGNCTNNGGVASKAMTQSGKATVEGGAPLQLPQTLQLPTPPVPNPLPPTGTATITTPGPTTCTDPPPNGLGVSAANCNVTGNVITLFNNSNTPMTLPNVVLKGQAQLVLTASATAGTTNDYVFNSLSLGSTNNSLQVESPSKSYGVKINIAGLNSDGTTMSTPVLDMSGGSNVGGFTTTPHNPADACTGCSQYDSSLTQFIYGGTGTANVGGNPAAASVYYMPNAYVNFSGNSSLYGAIIAHDLFINGGGNSVSINYDQSLSGKGQTASAPMLASFSWKKY
jgi:hypothetical protein